jgi:hypothetical protein
MFVLEPTTGNRRRSGLRPSLGCQESWCLDPSRYTVHAARLKGAYRLTTNIMAIFGTTPSADHLGLNPRVLPIAFR